LLCLLLFPHLLVLLSKIRPGEVSRLSPEAERRVKGRPQDPNPAMGTEQAVQLLDSLADSKNNPITCQGMGAFEPKAKKA